MARKSYVIQESGAITLPAEFRKKYGLEVGDEITFVETDAGLLISPRQALVNKLLAELGDELLAQNVSLDDLIEMGREERGALLKQFYNIDEKK